MNKNLQTTSNETGYQLIILILTINYITFLSITTIALAPLIYKNSYINKNDIIEYTITLPIKIVQIYFIATIIISILSIILYYTFQFIIKKLLNNKITR